MLVLKIYFTGKNTTAIECKSYNVIRSESDALHVTVCDTHDILGLHGDIENGYTFILEDEDTVMYVENDKGKTIDRYQV